MTYPKCKGSLPHQYETYTAPDGTVCDFKNQLIEICVICGDKVRWNKARSGRIDTKEYLQAHIREFAQPYGRTGKIYEMLYGNPNKMNIWKKGTNANS